MDTSNDLDFEEADEEIEEFNSDEEEEEIVLDEEEEVSSFEKLSSDIQFLISCMWKCFIRTTDPSRGFRALFKRQEDLVKIVELGLVLN